MHLKYKAPPTVARFLKDDSPTRVICGPQGSGKSSGSVIETLRRSISRRPDSDGIRRAKFAVVRNCFDDQTEILTEKRGWQLFRALLPEDRVASLHGDEMKFETPRLHYAAPYKGEMVRFRTQNCDLVVTPDHFMWVDTINGRTKARQGFKHEMARDIYGKTNREFRATSEWCGGKTNHTKAFFEFLGLWFAEGSAGVYQYPGEKRLHYRLNISQKKYTDYAEKVIRKAGFSFTRSDAGDGNWKFVLSLAQPQHVRLCKYLARMGTATVKRVPVWVKNAPAEHIRSFLRGYIAGDGHIKKDGHDATMMWTASNGMADDLHEMVVRAGYSASVSVADNRGKTVQFRGRTIHKGQLWRVAVFTKKRSRPQSRLKSSWSKVGYDGMVYCVEVSTHIVYVRRSGVAVWCGQTVPMLRDTTIPTFLQWFPHGTLGTWHATDKTYYFKFGDVESQVLFRALDDKDDIAKLLSAEYTGCYFNEFREIDPVIYEAMTKRVGRWKTDPNWTKKDIDEAWYGIWADTNPPQVGSWHHHMMEKVIPNNWAVYKQPSGRSPQAENIEYLRSDYYNTDGLSDEYVRVMIDGEYGYDQSGLPVFGKVFLPDWHVQKEPLRVAISSQYPLQIGLDAGLKPAAVIGQRDYKGRLLVLGECYVGPTESMGMERFVTTRLMPYLQTHFPGLGRAMVTADPAINHRSQANEVTPYDILTRYFTVALAFTDKLPARLGAAETWMAGHVDGKPKIVFDPRTPFLQAALAHNYRFQKKKNTGGAGEDMKDVPEKNHPSNTADAFMYLCMSVAGSSGQAVQVPARKVVVSSSKGWT